MNFEDETRVSGMPDPLNHAPGYDTERPATNQPVTGRPQILAPQANDPELPEPTVHQVKRRRTGPILVIFALVAVAVAAALAAAYSQLGRDDTATPVPDSTAPSTTTQPTTSVPPPAADPNALQITLTEDPFICDGGTRPVGLISGATPNEEVAFSSPEADNISPGQAIDDGTLPIRWQCTDDQIGKVWNLTAAGVSSGKAVTFVVTGAAPGTEASAPAAEATDAPTASTATPPAGDGLVVVVDENPFVCNGEARAFGQLSNAAPNEAITFTSPQASGIQSGNADASGERPIRWSCSPDQAGTTWELTATGQTSGRSVIFTFTGG